eukprot:CAMPEP_0176042648 /NCGR_PEP_ID=MMETSP0120_2-20121206/21162_1 /TAXON_ID=160619 /ORGANISM="Kryptoperidinium foliaceum, Strain CCMP 1326" /LENGTH=764 /DNA_ID=CAMNT_0017376057 /DNA_START=66 /DNA_END=2360 /DNA_ORIENTATION=-
MAVAMELAPEAGSETWRQIVLVGFSAALMALLGWIMMSRNEPSKGQAQDVDEEDLFADSDKPMPVFAANFSNSKRRGGRRQRGLAPKASAKVTPPASEKQPAKAVVQEDAEEEEVAAEAVVEEVPAAPAPAVAEAPQPAESAKAKKSKKKAAVPAQPEPVVAAPAPAAAPKPTPAAEAAMTPEQKAAQSEVRKIQKKLREISDLKKRRAEGAQLSEGQAAKVHQEAALEKALAEAGSVLEAAMQAQRVEAAVGVPAAAKVPAVEPEEVAAAPEVAAAEQEAEEEAEEAEDFQEAQKAKKKRNRKQKKAQQKESEEAAEEAPQEEEAAVEEEQQVVEEVAEEEVEAEAEEEEAEEEEEEEVGEAEEEAEEEEDADEEAEEEEAEEEAADEEEVADEEAAADEEEAEAEVEEEAEAEVEEEAEEAEEEEAEEEQEAVEAEGEDEAEEEAADADSPEASAGDGTPAVEDEQAEEDEEPAAAAEAAPAAEEEGEEEEEEEAKKDTKIVLPKDFVRPSYPPTEKEKEMMKLKKKIREIEDLEKKMADGVKLAANQEAKLAKKAGLLEDLATVEAVVEPHTIEWSAVVQEVMNPMLGVMLKVDGHTDPLPMSAAHMSPPVTPDNLVEVGKRFRKGQELKVRVMRGGTTCTNMSIDEEDFRYAESQEIAEKLKAMKEHDEKTIWALDMWEWSAEKFDGTVVSVKDQCMFVRIFGSREVRVSCAEMPADCTIQDPISKISKTNREKVTEGMEVQVRLRWDSRNDRVTGSWSA